MITERGMFSEKKADLFGAEGVEDACRRYALHVACGVVSRV